MIMNIKTYFHYIFRTLGNHESDFVRFFRNYLAGYTKKDRRVMKQAFDRYMYFLSTLPDGRRRLNPDPETIRQFADYLTDTSKGGGAYSTMARFRKAVGKAVEAGVLKENPCMGIRISPGSNGLTKDILSDDEISMLIATHPRNENSHIRNAFIFSLYTGLRFCDVRKLKYSDADFTNRILTVNQAKTQGISANSIVHIPLRDDLIALIGVSTKDGFIFKLPSHPTCLKALREWTSEAGIHKHITWHCARHTFATNILKNGADVRVVAELLGHSSLKYVERYTRAIDKRKIQAIDSLPPIV